MLLEIAKIKATPEAQPRVSLHYPTVEEYAEALRGRAEFPPVVVFHDGTDYWLADGFHRLEAYKKEDRTKIPVEVRDGTKRDAILCAVGANYKHGLPRTNEDKRRAVETLLRDDEWRLNSDNWIASKANVTHKTVSAVRAELEATWEIPKLSERRGKDGKTRKLPRKSDPAPRVEEAEATVARVEVAVDEPAAPRSEPRPAEEREAPKLEPVKADPLKGCASMSERDAVDAWVAQGAMLYERFGDGAREYMRVSWDKRLAKLEGY